MCGAYIMDALPAAHKSAQCREEFPSLTSLPECVCVCVCVCVFVCEREREREGERECVTSITDPKERCHEATTSAHLC